MEYGGCKAEKVPDVAKKKMFSKSEINLSSCTLGDN